MRVLDNFSSGKRENLAALQGDLEILEGDLRDAEMIKAATRDVDLVFHLAAFVSVPQSMLEPEACFAINVAGTVDAAGSCPLGRRPQSGAVFQHGGLR